MEEKKETQVDFVIAWVDGGDPHGRESGIDMGRWGRKQR